MRLARCCLMLAVGLLLGKPAQAEDQLSGTPAPHHAGPASPSGLGASIEARRVADWVSASGDNQGLPFMIVDKIAAQVFLFDERARLLGAAPALLGLAKGDDSVAGIGQRKLSTIKPEERTTPAGRFTASLGNDFTQDILWIDYDTALSLHRVIRGNPVDRRHQRLQSATSLDNRVTYGCINVPVKFYDELVKPAFANSVGVIYILPETRTVDQVFAISGSPVRH